MTLTQYPIQNTIYIEFGSTSPIKRGGVLPNKSKQHYLQGQHPLTGQRAANFRLLANQ